MFELPTDVQWKTLFRIGRQIRELAPWKEYDNTEVITVKNKNDDDPVFCSILGSNKEYYGVSIYCGYKNLNGLLKIQKAGDNPPFHVVIANQECITMYFGEREFMGQGDFSAMEQGEYTPPVGNLQHIFFRTYAPGLAPWYIDANETELLIDTLERLYIGLKEAEKSQLRPHFKEGETLYISNDDEKGWETTIRPLPYFEVNEERHIIRDEILLAKCKRLPRTAFSYELDLVYLTNPVSGKNHFRPIFPKMIVLSNHDEGTIEKQLILDEEANVIDELLEFIIQFLKEKGRPRLMIIRENSIGHYINDLCTKTGIHINERRDLDIIDDFLGIVGTYYPEE